MSIVLLVSTCIVLGLEALAMGAMVFGLWAMSFMECNDGEDDE